MFSKSSLRRGAAGITAAFLIAMSSAALPLRTGVTAMAAETTTICNPIIWSDVPDNDVIRVGDTYYMISTTMFFSPGAPIMKSKDLVSWEICSYVYDTLADGDVQNLTNGKNDYAHGQWAASLRYHDGNYYVFFGSYGTGKSYIYKTNDIENGTWTRSEINGMYHDASILFDDDGRNYLVYGGGGEIKIKELNSEMTGFKNGGADKTLFKTGLDNLAGEGSHIQKIGDYYYVFVIAWPSNSGRIELCYRSRELLGTYEGKTVLNSGIGSYGSGVAQGGIVDTPDGKWYAMLFQDHGSVGRIPVLVPVTWENDWPMMGVNGKVPVTFEVDGGYSGTQLAKDDDFSYSSNDLALEWQWNHNPDNTAWSVTERDGWLRLRNKTLATNILDARNTLTQRTEGPSCSGVIKLDATGMKAGDYAGLSAFQFKYGNVGVYVADDGSKKIYMAENGGYSSSASVSDSYNKIVEEVPLSGNDVYLKTEFTFNTINSDMSSSYNIDKVNFFYSYDGSSWTKIGSELSMSYDLKLFTGYRNGIYSYATKNTGGYADIDFFDYERAEWNSATVIEPDENGYFYHSTFEGDLDSWTGRGAAELSTSGRTSYAGSESLLVQGREASWNGAARTLGSAAFKPGESYSFSADVMYLDGGATDTFYMKLEYTDANGDAQYPLIAEATAVKGNWVQLANTSFTIPTDAKNPRIYIETADSTINFYVDEAIGAVEGTVIDGPKAIDIHIGDINCDGIINALDTALARKGMISGFTDSIAAASADVNEDGTVGEADLIQINDFVLGRISGFSVAEEPEQTFEYNANLPYSDAPASYKNECAQQGTVEKLDYNTSVYSSQKSKYANVYLPFGYNQNDKSVKYNVFYLMHGGGENQDTIFSDDVNMKRILDNMIMNGDIEPMIVVTPTFNDGDGDMTANAQNFWNELRNDLIPAVEGKYNTYAKSTSPADLKASRAHRAYGGFSMGGLTTWYTFMNDLDYIMYFMPLSGDNWAGSTPEQKAQITAEAAAKQGYGPDDFRILAATGTEDIAYDALSKQIDAMKNLTDSFTYTSDFSKGNLYFLTCPGATHWWGYVVNYIYDGLPYFFHEI